MGQRALASEVVRLYGKGWKVVAKSEQVKHVLGHRLIRAVFWEVLPPGDFTPKDWKALPEKRIGEVAVPRLIERWLEKKRP